MPNQAERLIGIDVIRAVAIAGMALVHFAMVLSSQETGSFLAEIVENIAGRPATMFMMLAGIGISLRMQRVAEDQGEQARASFVRRGIFFLLFGFLNLALWPGDILRVYGIAYLCAAVFLFADNRVLWICVMLPIIGFLVGSGLVDFETNWDFSTLTYHNLWTLEGSLLNLFYNGFRAVFPWLGLLFLGMLIGRCDLTDASLRKKLMLLGLALWLIAESISWTLLATIEPGSIAGLDAETLAIVLGTDSLPPVPLFLLSSSGFALFVIIGCVHLLTSSPQAQWLAPVAAAGKMAFTWYIGHIILVIAAGVVTNFQGDLPMSTAFTVSAAFAVSMVLVSYLYLKVFRQGPLEWVLRKAT